MNPNANVADARRLLRAQKLLTAEYEASRVAMIHDPSRFEACIGAMRRLGTFLATREIPSDIAEKLNASRDQASRHIPYDDLERYHLNKISESTELAMIEEHLLWCQSCLDRMEATERFINLARRGVLRGGFQLEVEAF